MQAPTVCNMQNSETSYSRVHYNKREWVSPSPAFPHKENAFTYPQVIKWSFLNRVEEVFLYPW